MKALEILTYIKASINDEEISEKFENMTDNEFKACLYEAIDELKELQSRSCEGCKYCAGEAKQSFCVLRLMPAHMYEFEFCCNRYEAKPLS